MDVAIRPISAELAMTGSGQKRYELLRLPAAKSTTEHMNKIVPVPEVG